MAYWTVLGTLTADAPNHFGVTLDTGNMTWIANGPAVGQAFKTKAGRYIIKPAPELGTYLMKPAGNDVVAILRNLHGGSQVNARGNGQQFETAEVFEWRLESL